MAEINWQVAHYHHEKIILATIEEAVNFGEPLINGVDRGSFICAEYRDGGGITITVADSSGDPAMAVTLKPRACDALLAQIRAIYDQHGLHQL